ncbi:MAG: AAA family ATPase [Sulfuricurvum sp.]|jgi:ABC-type cobalamin/Fe3+-siderophores transport system ATPase subunit
MKIIEVNLTERVTKTIGLGPVSMKKIGSTILLAGKNGSGKTRLLNLIRQQASVLHTYKSQQQQSNSYINSYKQQIEQQSQQKQQLEQNIQAYEHQIDSWKQQIEQQFQQKQQFEQHIQSYEHQIETWKQYIEQQPLQTEQTQQLEQNIKSYEQNINSWKQQIELQPQQTQQLEQNIQSYEQNINNWKDQIAVQPQQKQQLEQQIKEQEIFLKTPVPIIVDKEQEGITVVDFVPNKIELEDWSNLTKQQWMQRADQAISPGVSTLHQSTIPLIQQVLERWVNATHPGLEFPEGDKQKAIDDYKRLQDIIKSFIGETIYWNKDGSSTIYDKPIFQAELSAGQRVLLQLGVAIYAQGGTLANHIIFMDEPENHLHPSAVIDLLDTIKAHNPDGQIWIATHSIPLLSHFDASSLWFVEDGIVKHSGKKPELVLRSLLGNDERIQKLRDFTSLPSELARNRFAFECLCTPQVVETDSSDPQSLQLNEQLKIIWKNKTSINLLDFGAGKGRMIANLGDYENVSKETLNYHAYDPSASDKDYCLQNISLSYDDAENRYHNSIENLRIKLGDNYFDVLVLSNVLHEIPHLQWHDTFTKMKKLLKEDGYLLLIEDCLLPTGELAHRNGFIVFNTLHLIKLFEIPVTETRFIKHDARFDSEEQRGRLMAHLIPTPYLGNISSATIIDALLELKESGKTEIRKIREGDVSYSNGLAHSFWIQQFANSALCLSELGV